MHFTDTVLTGKEPTTTAKIKNAHKLQRYKSRCVDSARTNKRKLSARGWLHCALVSMSSFVCVSELSWSSGGRRFTCAAASGADAACRTVGRGSWLNLSGETTTGGPCFPTSLPEIHWPKNRVFCEKRQNRLNAAPSMNHDTWQNVKGLKKKDGKLSNRMGGWPHRIGPSWSCPLVLSLCRFFLEDWNVCPRLKGQDSPPPPTISLFAPLTVVEQQQYPPKVFYKQCIQCAQIYWSVRQRVHVNTRTFSLLFADTDHIKSTKRATEVDEAVCVVHVYNLRIRGRHKLQNSFLLPKHPQCICTYIVIRADFGQNIFVSCSSCPSGLKVRGERSRHNIWTVEAQAARHKATSWSTTSQTARHRLLTHSLGTSAIAPGPCLKYPCAWLSPEVEERQVSMCEQEH